MRTKQKQITIRGTHLHRHLAVGPLDVVLGGIGRDLQQVVVRRLLDCAGGENTSCKGKRNGSAKQHKRTPSAPRRTVVRGRPTHPCLLCFGSGQTPKLSEKGGSWVVGQAVRAGSQAKSHIMRKNEAKTDNQPKPHTQTRATCHWPDRTRPRAKRNEPKFKPGHTERCLPPARPEARKPEPRNKKQKHDSRKDKPFSIQTIPEPGGASAGLPSRPWAPWFPGSISPRGGPSHEMVPQRVSRKLGRPMKGDRLRRWD